MFSVNSVLAKYSHSQGPGGNRMYPPGPFMKCLLTEVLEVRVQTRDGKASSDQQQWDALPPLSLKGLGEGSDRHS